MLSIIYEGIIGKQKKKKCSFFFFRYKVLRIYTTDIKWIEDLQERTALHSHVCNTVLIFEQSSDKFFSEAKFNCCGFVKL